MDLKEEKALLRSRTRQLAQGLSLREKAESDRAIVQRLLALDEYQNASSVFCFVGTPAEINTLPVIMDALQQGKTVAVPLCLAPGVMEARVLSAPEELVTGAFGIPEPRANAPLLPKESIGFAVVPCLTCDRQGGRLGKGGGYYDRYLAGRGFAAAALCREALLCEEAPMEPQDVPVDLVVTDRAVYRNGHSE